MKVSRFVLTALAVAGVLLTSSGSAQADTDTICAWTNFVGLHGTSGSADGTGSVARFKWPTGVAVDGAGNVYVADCHNFTVRKVTPAGVVTTLAGSPGLSGSADGTGSAARFHNAHSIAVDSAGNLYVGDDVNCTIRKITPAGVVTTLAGSPGLSGSADGTGSAARFNQPYAVAVDGAGNVYVADAYYNQTIRKITPAGVVTTLAGSAGNYGNVDGTGSAARFCNPLGVAVDSGGNVYVADTYNDTIRKVTQGGVVTTLAGGPPLNLECDGTNNTATFGGPACIAVDSAGILYVGDISDTVRKVTPVGTNFVVTTLAGSPGLTGYVDGIGSAARFGGTPGDSVSYGLYGVAVDGVGNLYVADVSNNRVSKGWVSAAPDIRTGSPLPSGMVGAAYSQTLTASGGSTPYTWSILSGALPSGLSLSGGGVISGTPVQATNASFTVRVVGNNNLGSTEAFNLTIYPPTAPVIATGSPLPSGNVSVAYSQTVTATGGVAPYAWSIVSNALPSGMSLSGGGVISGTPVETTNASFSVSVMGANSLASTKVFSMTIDPPPYVWANFVGLPLTSGSSDGIGSAARFYRPLGVAVDSSGNAYVADTQNHTIRRITPGGSVTTLAGSPGLSGSADGTGSAARFDGPMGVAADSSGNVYVADNFNHTIRKVTLAGVVTTLAGSATNSGYADGTGSAARFYSPTGVAVDSSGNVYVTDHNNYTIRKVTQAGIVTTLAGSHGSWGSADGTGSAARFYYPFAVAVDSSGNVYVTDNNRTIRKITAAGVVTTLAGSATSSGSADGIGSSARFYDPDGVAVDSSGNVYVADMSNFTIRKITVAAMVTTIGGSAGLAGSADGTGSAARFHGPSGVAVDSGGNVYVADTVNSRITKGCMLSPPSPPTITTGSPLPSGTVGTAYNQTLTASGGATPYTWSISSGALPSGLSLSGGGVISGTPVLATNASFTVRVAGNDSLQSTKVFSIAVASPTAPTITTGSPLPSGTVGTNYNFALAASGGSTPYTWFIVSNSLSAGLGLSSNGVISGTPSGATISNFRVRVTGADMLYSERDFSLQINVSHFIYVALEGHHQPPFTNWWGAATNIQAAVNACSNGDTVWVTNGTWVLINQIVVSNAITIRSVNGPTVTVVNGNGQITSNRCFSLSGNCTLDGFTITNGYIPSTYGYGGGVYCGNTNPIINNCRITGNSVSDGNSSAGGVCGCTLYNCTISGNFAAYGGGIAGSTLYNCTISGNSSHQDGGGAYGCTLYNCTISSNSSDYGGGSAGGTLINCILYFNSSPQGYPNYDGDSLDYCCTTPLPTGIGNITNNPLFVNASAGNYRLSPGSPCIDKGTNLAWMVGATDLDGNPRIFKGTIDIGAYEYRSAPTGSIYIAQFWKASGSNSVCLSWNTTSDRVYAVQTTTNLFAAWTCVTDPAYANLLGGGNPVAYTNAVNDFRRYYRLIVW